MSSQRRKVIKPLEILSCVNDILEDESDAEPFEYSDDEYELENSSSSSDEIPIPEIPQGNYFLFYFIGYFICYLIIC